VKYNVAHPDASAGFNGKTLIATIISRGAGLEMLMYYKTTLSFSMSLNSTI